MIKVLMVTMAFGFLGLSVLIGFVLILAPRFLDDQPPHPGDEEDRP